MPNRLSGMRKIILFSLLLLAFTAAAGDFSYLFSRGDGAIVSGNMDLDRMLSMRDQWTGEFLWARIGGKQYLIRDAATLAEARGAFAQADALHDEQERLMNRMKPIETREEQLEDEMDNLSDDLSDRDDLTSAERRRMEARLAELEKQMEPIERQLRELEREEERLDDREEKLVEAAEEKLLQLIEQAIARGKAERLR